MEPTSSPTLPIPPRKIRRPWEKLSHKIHKKTGLAIPMLLLPLLARLEIARLNKGTRYGVRAHVALEATGLAPQVLEALIARGILTIHKAPRAPDLPPDADPPPLVRPHPTLSRLLKPHLNHTRAMVQWAQSLQRPALQKQNPQDRAEQGAEGAEPSPQNPPPG